MPELPEVETVRRGLAPVMENSVLARVEARRKDLRFPFPDSFRERLEGRKINSLWRRAKYLVADVEGDELLVMHLGMSGSFRVEGPGLASQPGGFAHEKGRDERHDHVVFHLHGNGASSRVIYNDPRRFGFMMLVAKEGWQERAPFASLGMEPTGNSLDASAISGIMAGKNAPLKAALLDQRLIAGLGNIYVCEALWQAGLSPRRAAGTIGSKGNRAMTRCDALATSIRDVIARAIDAGGSTLRDHRLTDGSLGYFQHSFNVYDREGEACRKPGCGGRIERMEQSGRSTYWCASCQR
ncbi:MAG: bifunctional DNA-formamidopyrimidine glycosylase/DNA-(apurinic or apyrimidinic site) lyase [Rhizobiaceae bacterium]